MGGITVNFDSLVFVNKKGIHFLPFETSTEMKPRKILRPRHVIWTPRTYREIIKTAAISGMRHCLKKVASNQLYRENTSSSKSLVK